MLKRCQRCGAEVPLDDTAPRAGLLVCIGCADAFDVIRYQQEQADLIESRQLLSGDLYEPPTEEIPW